MKNNNTIRKIRQDSSKKLIFSAVMLGVATTLELVSGFIPLELPFGGRITIVSMLPIILVSFIYGVKQGIFTGFCFSIIQMLIGMKNVSAFFMPGDSQMVLWKALFVCFMDYILAYSILGFSGILRKKLNNKALGLAVCSILGLSLRYIVHIISGAVFFGAWAEWFFSQDGFYAIGETILKNFSGFSLAFVYSVFYNGLYMIPEIILTAICSSMIGAIIFRKTK